jgi:5-(carboxyamino)imidazole ribonucleotide mutase
MTQPTLVGIVMGSESDRPLADKISEVLKEFSVSFEISVLSAHRTPKKTAAYSEAAEKRGLKVLIGVAGLAAALPGVLAAHTILPVIGLPVGAGKLAGTDAMVSMVQMPPGIPVAAVGIDNSKNAALLAVSILALQDGRLSEQLKKFRASFGDA